jgi:hypothetical protein
MSEVNAELIDPVEGDPLYPFATPTDPDTGLFIPGIDSLALLTCKTPTGDVVDISGTVSEGTDQYVGFLLTTDYGGGTYIFRWFWNGPVYYGAIEMKVRVNKSKVLH